MSDTNLQFWSKAGKEPISTETESDEAEQTIKKKFTVDPNTKAEAAPEVDEDPTPLDEEPDKRSLAGNAAEAYDDKIEDVIKIPDDKPGERSTNVPMTAGSSRHSQDQGARFLKVNQLGFGGQSRDF